MDFQVEIVERPAILAAGFKTRTSMAKASVDCGALWSDKFGPVMCAFPADPAFPNESYGISTVVDQAAGVFDYWAVMPLKPGSDTPEGMETVELPAGSYAVCPLGSLAEITPAFDYIYQKWAPAQTKYALDMAAPFYELYRDDYMTTGKLSIYCRLVNL